MSAARSTASCKWEDRTSRSSSSRAMSFSGFGFMATKVAFCMGLPRSGATRNDELTEWGSARQPLDLGAALAELLLDPLEAAIEVVDAADHRLALRGEAGDDQRHRGAQIGGHDLRAGQAAHAGDEGGIAFEVDTGAEPCQLLHMHEAILEDRLAHRGGALGRAHQGNELGLQIGGEAGERLGLDGN